MHSIRIRSLLVWVLGVLFTGCGDTGGGETSSHLATSQEPIVWNPDAGGVQLVQQHIDWHTKPCSVNGQPLGGQVGIGRRCTNTGEDFLLWHRMYLNRLRAEFQRQGRSEDITPWYNLPAAMKSAGHGWTPALQTAENNLFALKNAAGVRFASLNEFGSYLETQYYNSLRVIAASAYGEWVMSGHSSPQSTYFFKLHGLIDWHLTRFLRGDFNWDGRSDLFVRNANTGENQFWLMNDTSVSSTVATSSMSVDSCNWYVGATPDLTMDGRNDVVWHGPGCNKVLLWIMNGVAPLTGVVVGAVNSDWTLIGHGDFNADQRPDLVWRHNASLDVSVWIMNGTTQVTSRAYDIPASWTPIGVADLTDNGPPDFIYRRIQQGVAQYAVHYVGFDGGLGGQFTIGGLSSDGYNSPRAFGRYQQGGSLGDIVMEQHPPVATPGSWRVSRLNTVVMGGPSFLAPTPQVGFAPGQQIQGPR
jgi:hypothetical protein